MNIVIFATALGVSRVYLCCHVNGWVASSHGASPMFLKVDARQVKVQLRCEIVVFACLIAKVRL